MTLQQAGLLLLQLVAVYTSLVTSSYSRIFRDYVATSATIGLLSLTPVALAVGGNSVSFIREGTDLFRHGYIEQSVVSFNTAILDDPNLKKFLWQRGLSLYFADKFLDCADQFEFDVAENPNDTEEILWSNLCQSQLEVMDDDAGVRRVMEGSRKEMLPFPSTDPRPIMKLIYDVYSGKLPPSFLERYGDSVAATKSLSLRNASNVFYSYLYLSLYYDSIELNASATWKYINQALSTEYAKMSNDYMIAVAKAQLQRLSMETKQQSVSGVNNRL